MCAREDGHYCMILFNHCVTPSSIRRLLHQVVRICCTDISFNTYGCTWTFLAVLLCWVYYLNFRNECKVRMRQNASDDCIFIVITNICIQGRTKSIMRHTSDRWWYKYAFRYVCTYGTYRYNNECSLPKRAAHFSTRVGYLTTTQNNFTMLSTSLHIP